MRAFGFGHQYPFYPRPKKHRYSRSQRSNVDRKDGIDPADILWTKYYYSLHPNGALPAAPEDDSYPLVDITGDGTIDPQDILYAIFDYIASLGAEGEAPPADETPPAAADLHDAALVWLMFAEELVAKRKTQGMPGFVT